MKFKHGHKDHMSISHQQLRVERGTVKNVGQYGTRVLALRIKDMKFQAMRYMQKNPALTSAEAHKIVAEQAAKHEQWVFRDEDGNR